MGESPRIKKLFERVKSDMSDNEAKAREIADNKMIEYSIPTTRLEYAAVHQAMREAALEALNSKDAREKGLVICLEDITRWAVTPSASTTHFNQICEIKETAKKCLAGDKNYSSVVAEYISQKATIAKLEESLKESCDMERSQIYDMPSGGCPLASDLEDKIAMLEKKAEALRDELSNHVDELMAADNFIDGQKEALNSKDADIAAKDKEIERLTKIITALANKEQSK